MKKSSSMQLDVATWIRFVIWIHIDEYCLLITLILSQSTGSTIYFGYGTRDSKHKAPESEDIPISTFINFQ